MQMLERALPQCSDKTFLLTAYAEGDPSAPDIPDPFGGDTEEYAQCVVTAYCNLHSYLRLLCFEVCICLFIKHFLALFFYHTAKQRFRIALPFI